jgi:hypothetical protein
MHLRRFTLCDSKVRKVKSAIYYEVETSAAFDPHIVLSRSPPSLCPPSGYVVFLSSQYVAKRDWEFAWLHNQEHNITSVRAGNSQKAATATYCVRVSEKVRRKKEGRPGDNGGQPHDEGAALRSIQTLSNV